MGFLTIFRKGSADDPPPTESWPLFAFGKLPVYKDFISVGLTDDVSREFRDWLSNGFSRHWSSRDDCRSAEIPLHAFLLRLPESRKMAVGALWGSSDQGGLRKFPFALFTILPAGKPAASVLTALDYLPVFETRAREIRRKYDSGGSLAAVYQDLRGAKIEIPVRKEEQIRVRLGEALSRWRVGSLARALFGDGAEVQWSALLSGLDAAHRNPTAGAAAFRLPLAEEMVPLHQLKLWVVRLAKAAPGGVSPAGVLYRTGGPAPRGVIFFRDARAEDILLLHPAAIPTDFVEEIPRPADRQRRRQRKNPCKRWNGRRSSRTSRGRPSPDLPFPRRPPRRSKQPRLPKPPPPPPLRPREKSSSSERRRRRLNRSPLPFSRRPHRKPRRPCRPFQKARLPWNRRLLRGLSRRFGQPYRRGTTARPRAARRSRRGRSRRRGLSDFTAAARATSPAGARRLGPPPLVAPRSRLIHFQTAGAKPSWHFPNLLTEGL